MDFFAAQSKSLRKTRWLTFWFVLAVVSIIALIYLLVVFFHVNPRNIQSLWDVELFFWTCMIVGGGIGVSSLYKMWEISRHGGTLIATQLGGQLILRETNDPAEKRLINVIDEMAIAAGIPAPVAFVLPEESGLNAFAAGLDPQDSVIGVTRGLLENMNRDELQGVVAHEVSHIVNGDSYLNLKLIGVLFGIYVITIVGRKLTRARGRKSAGVILFGLLLWLIGLIGLFFGRLIQSAVSREREYLADASAVQFTRNPTGLSSALKKLQSYGSAIQHPEAGVASHLFFGTCGASLFNTHPPLDARISRLDGILFHKSNEAERKFKRNELRPEQLDQDIAELLTILAHAGHENVDMAKANYQAAIAHSPAGIKYPFTEQSERSHDRISQALSRLALTAMPYRKRLLQACEVAVRHDGRIATNENELLRAFAQSLDCPAPPG